MALERQSRRFAVIALSVAMAASSLRPAHAAEPNAPAVPAAALPSASPPIAGEPTPVPGPTLADAPRAASAVASAEPRVPLLERWWFWTAVAAVAVSAFVIVAASATAGPPQTELGNRVAF